MSAPTTATRATASVIELEIATESGPGWLGSGAEPVTVSLTAETVRFVDAELHFITGNTVVRSVPRSEVTALTWRGSPARGRANSQHRNSGVIWTDEDRARLTAEVLGDLSWIEISNRHERSVSAVRREAVRMRLVDEIGRRLDEPPTPLSALSTTPAPTPSLSPSPHSIPTATASLPPSPTRLSPTAHSAPATASFPSPPSQSPSPFPSPSTLATPPPSPTSRATRPPKQ
jgi:hypothetical protein